MPKSINSLLNSSTATKQINNVQYVTGEFWSAKQRQANRIHEISYRACFKPQLVKYFIDHFSDPKDVVYDPFMGRGTTIIEANLNNRIPYGNDINPLCKVLTEPRLNPPTITEIKQRLNNIDLTKKDIEHKELLHFYHPETLKDIESLRDYFITKDQMDNLDKTDRWIQMVVINRLTGHSSGFLSVYTLPPNQAVSIKSQIKINQRLKQTPPYRNLKNVVIRKSKILLSQYPFMSNKSINKHWLLTTNNSYDNPAIKDNEVALTVTSPPFLDEVDYAQDNWLRCWFLGTDAKKIKISMHKNIQDWQNFIHKTLQELTRITKTHGYIAFEVGEVRKKSINLEEYVIKATKTLPLQVIAVFINQQNFTKTSNCWGVDNNNKGTNSNRIVLIRKI